MKKFIQLILLCIIAGFFSTSFAQKDKVINTIRSSSIHNYVAPLIMGDNIINVYPQSANYWTGSVDTSGGTEVSLVKANGNGVGWMVFDISGIPPGSIINSVSFYGYVYDNNWPYWSITPMGTVNPLTPNPQEIILQIISNYKQDAAYSFNTETGNLPVGWLSRALVNNAAADLQNAIPQGWFAIGFTDFDISTSYYINFQGWAEANVPYLVVDCTSPTPHEVGTLSIDIPYYVNPGIISPKATVFSSSNTTETFNVTMTITPGGYSSTKTVANIPPGSTQQVTFDEWNVTFGEYIVEVCTQLAADPDQTNDCKSKNVYCCWPPFVLLTQLPNQVNGLFADETCALCPTGQQSIADNLTVSDVGTFSCFASFVIWGGYYPENIPNTTDDFTFIIHSDAQGSPGTVIETRSGIQPTTRTSTGVILYGCDEYIFTFDFASDPFMIPNSGTYWIEIYNNSVESGNFFWETGNLDVTFGVLGSAWTQSAPGTTWNMDGATDLSILVTNEQLVPIELVSFKATANGSEVNLNWLTATETNNKGFEVQRSSVGDFETLAFVEGHGTTTETKVYSYSDRNIYAGSYSYRLKIIDFDGTFSYSNIVEADFQVPTTFSLQQNYPNPFNPSTTIKYSVPSTERVVIKVYGILGNEISVLVNEYKAAGNYEVNFNAQDLVSGVYFYRIKSGDFVQTKKMVLLH